MKNTLLTLGLVLSALCLQAKADHNHPHPPPGPTCQDWRMSFCYRDLNGNRQWIARNVASEKPYCYRSTTNQYYGISESFHSGLGAEAPGVVTCWGYNIRKGLSYGEEEEARDICGSIP